MEGLRPPSLPGICEGRELSSSTSKMPNITGIHAAAADMSLRSTQQQHLDSALLCFPGTHEQHQQPTMMGDAVVTVQHGNGSADGVIFQPGGSTAVMPAAHKLQQQQQHECIHPTHSAPTVTSILNTSQSLYHRNRAGVHALLPATRASRTADPFGAAAAANAAVCTAAAAIIAQCDDNYAILTGVPPLAPAVPVASRAPDPAELPAAGATIGPLSWPAAAAYDMQAGHDQQQPEHSNCPGQGNPPSSLEAVCSTAAISSSAAQILQQQQQSTCMATGAPWLASWPLATSMAASTTEWSAEAVAAFHSAYAATMAASGLPWPGCGLGQSSKAAAVDFAGQPALQLPEHDTAALASQPELQHEGIVQAHDVATIPAAAGHAGEHSTPAVEEVAMAADSQHVGLSTAAAAAVWPAPLAAGQQQQIPEDNMHHTGNAAAPAASVVTDERPQRRTARRLNDLFEMWAASEASNEGGSSDVLHASNTGNVQQQQQQPGSIVLSIGANPSARSAATPPPVVLLPVHLQHQQQPTQVLAALEAAAAASKPSAIAKAEQYGIADALWAMELDLAAGAAGGGGAPTERTNAPTLAAAASVPAAGQATRHTAAAAAHSMVSHPTQVETASQSQQQQQQPNSPGNPLLMSPGVYHFPASGLHSPLAGLPRSPGQFFSSLDPSGLTVLGSPSALHDELHLAMVGSPLARLSQLGTLDTALQHVGGSSSDSTPKPATAAAAAKTAQTRQETAAPAGAGSTGTNGRHGAKTPHSKAARTAAANTSPAAAVPLTMLSPSGRPSYSPSLQALQSPDAIFKTPNQRSMGSIFSPFGAAQPGSRGQAAAAADREGVAGLDAFSSGLLSSPGGACCFMTPINTRMLPQAGSWMSGGDGPGSSLMSPFHAAAAGSPALLPSPGGLINHPPLSSYTQLPNGAAYWDTGAPHVDAVLQEPTTESIAAAAAAVSSEQLAVQQQQHLLDRPKRAASVIAGAGARLHAAADNAAQPHKRAELAAAAAAAETAAALAAAGATAPAPAPSLQEDVKAGRAGSDLFNGAALLLGLAAAATGEKAPAAAAAAVATAAAVGGSAPAVRGSSTPGCKKARKKPPAPGLPAYTDRKLRSLEGTPSAYDSSARNAGDVHTALAAAATAPDRVGKFNLATNCDVSLASQMLPPAGRSQGNRARSKACSSRGRRQPAGSKARIATGMAAGMAAEMTAATAQQSQSLLPAGKKTAPAAPVSILSGSPDSAAAAAQEEDLAPVRLPSDDQELSGPVRPPAATQPGTAQLGALSASLAQPATVAAVHDSRQAGLLASGTTIAASADAHDHFPAAAAAASAAPPDTAASKADVMQDGTAAAMAGAGSAPPVGSSFAATSSGAAHVNSAQADSAQPWDPANAAAAAAAASPQKPQRIKSHLQQRPASTAHQPIRCSCTAPGTSSAAAADAAATVWPAIEKLHIVTEPFTLPKNILQNRHMVLQLLLSEQDDNEQQQQHDVKLAGDAACAPDSAVPAPHGVPLGAGASGSDAFKTPAATWPKLKISMQTTPRSTRSTARPQPGGLSTAAAVHAAQVQQEAAAAIAAKAAGVAAEAAPDSTVDAAEHAPEVAAEAAATNAALLQASYVATPAAGSVLANAAVSDAIVAAFPDAAAAQSAASEEPATPAVTAAAAPVPSTGRTVAALSAVSTAPAETRLEVQVVVPAAAAADAAVSNTLPHVAGNAEPTANAAAATTTDVPALPAAAAADNGSSRNTAVPATYPASPVPPPPRAAALELPNLPALASPATVEHPVTAAESAAGVPAATAVAVRATAAVQAKAKSRKLHAAHKVAPTAAAAAARDADAAASAAPLLPQLQPAATAEALAVATESVPASAADPHDVAEALTALTALRDQAPATASVAARAAAAATGGEGDKQNTEHGLATGHGGNPGADNDDRLAAHETLQGAATAVAGRLSLLPAPATSIGSSKQAAAAAAAAAASPTGTPAAQQQQQSLEFQPFFIDPDSPQNLRLRPKRAAAKDAERRLKQQQQPAPALPPRRNSSSSTKAAAASGPGTAIHAGDKAVSSGATAPGAAAAARSVGVQQQSRRPSGKIEKQQDKNDEGKARNRATAAASSKQGSGRKRTRDMTGSRSSIDELAAAAAAAAASDEGDDLAAAAAAVPSRMGTAGLKATRGGGAVGELEAKRWRCSSATSSKQQQLKQHKQRALAADKAAPIAAAAAAGSSKCSSRGGRSVPIQQSGLGNMGLALLSVVQQEAARESGEDEEQEAAQQQGTHHTSQQQESSSGGEYDSEDDSESEDAVSNMSDSSSDWAGSSDAESSGSDADSDADSEYGQSAPATKGSKKRGRQAAQSVRAAAAAAKKPKAASGRASSAANSTGTAPPAAAAANGGPRHLPAAALALQTHNPKGGRPLGAGNKGRMVPRFTNQQGQLKFGCRSTTHTGVYRCKRNTVRWRTQFSYGGKVLNVGSYPTEAEAARAWNAAAIHFRGRETLLNAVEPILPEDGGVSVAQALPQPPWGSQLLNSLQEGEQAAAAGQQGSGDEQRD